MSRARLVPRSLVPSRRGSARAARFWAARFSGVQSGLRFTRHSAAMRSLIIRNLSFSVCASALWALLPVIARDQLGLGASGYGLLSAGFGVGAVAGALAIPR